MKSKTQKVLNSIYNFFGFINYMIAAFLACATPYPVSFFKNGIITLEQFKKNVSIEGVDNLKKALENGKGAVIFTAHIGNFEWGASRIGSEGVKIWGVGLTRGNRFLDKYFEKNRKSKCLNTLNAT